MQVQSTFYRNVAAPLFEEWHRALNSPLTASMMSNLNSNQARWDLICQQEVRSAAGMAESIVSTSSSSAGGGSFQCGDSSRRGSLEPPANPHNRLSRSSGDGDDDSEDQCSPYPYMPLDTSKADNSDPLSPRRHSLPLSSIASNSDQLEVNLRRSLAVQELRRQNSELLAHLKVSKRRRVFANKTSCSLKAATVDCAMSTASTKEVTFHLSNCSIDEAGTSPAGNCRQQNFLLRRGSAPCTLLLNQINKIATSASKAASTASREHSPRGFNNRRRRSSLPSDYHVIDFDAMAAVNAANPGGKSLKKARNKLLRRKSAGACDNAENYEMTKRKNPALGKRGSLKSSSFGGVGGGGHHSHYSSKLYNGRLSWHGSKPTTTSNAANNKVMMEVVNERLLLRHNNTSHFYLEVPECNGTRRGSLPLELILC